MMHRIARTAFALAFGGSGLAHFLAPKFFIDFIPAIVPWRRFWVYASGAVEIGVAVGLTQRPLRGVSTQGVRALLLLFTPLHIYDLFRRQPVTGNKALALVRLVAQLFLIALANDLVRATTSPPRTKSAES